MLTLAARNVSRHRFRTALTLAAISFGVMALILSGGFVQDIFVQLGEALIHSQTGHIQIAKASYFSSGSRSPERYQLDGVDALEKKIAAFPEVADVLARSSFSGLLNNGRSDLAIVGDGVEPNKESRLGTSLRVTSGRMLEDRDAFGMMLGEGVAKALNLHSGDRVTLLANTAEGALSTLDMEVVGVFQTFSKDLDARVVRIPIRAAQELLGTRGANTLVLSLKDTASTAAVAQRLQPILAAGGMEMRSWSELNDFYAKTVALYDQQFGVLQFIILVMVVLSVSNSVNMSVRERVVEFGTMKALGNRNSAVFTLVVVESAILATIGACLGAAVGIGLAYLISAIGISMPAPPNSDIGYSAHILVIPSVVAASCVIGLFATIIASLPAARRVATYQVADALCRRF
jgi:putative ABC transport system permease protein